jgi:hypothetical protein
VVANTTPKKMRKRLLIEHFNLWKKSETNAGPTSWASMVNEAKFRQYEKMTAAKLVFQTW